MNGRFDRWLTAILRYGFDRLGLAQAESLLIDIILRRTHTLPADEALRVLFRLQAALYPTLGRKAVEYGGGTHTKHRHTRYHEFFTRRV